MGARQSRRSVDITTTPKKEGLPAEGVVGDAAAPGDGKLEKIEEADAKPTTNGVAPHTDATPEDKDKDKDEATEKEHEKEDAPKVDEPKVESPTTETPAEGAAEVTTPTEGTPASPTTATSPESKETKKKDKPKKKWSFRSISFGKKDKNKPVREDAPKNGDVAKETLAEGGEEAEAAAVASPADEKSAVSSPTEKEQSDAVAEAPAAATEAKAEEEETVASAAAPAVEAPAAAAPAASPAEEKKEEPSIPAPTPVPVEAKKVEEVEKEVEPANAEKIVEVSPVQAVIEAPVEVNSQSKPIATKTTAPSIIERKTSEDFPSQFPSSPPPTPIDPSPLQQAQQVAANASAIAEALKLPAEAANKADIAIASGQPASSVVLLSTSPSSAWRVENSSTPAPATEIPSNPPTSESPEQTGNASPIPVTITTITTTIAAVTDNNETPSSLEPEKSDVRVTEFETACDLARDDIVAVNVAEIRTKETDARNDVEVVAEENNARDEVEVLQDGKDIVEVVNKVNDEKDEVEMVTRVNDAKDEVEIVTEDSDEKDRVEVITEKIVESPKLAETIETPKTDGNDDLVIQTEEGPIPVSGDIVVEAKPALVVPESPVEEITPVEVLMEAETKRGSEESFPEHVESTEGLIVADTEKHETLGVPTAPIVGANEEENSEKDVPPPLPASPVPVPKATSQLLNFMSTQIADSPVIAEIVTSAKDEESMPEQISCPLPPPVTEEISCPLPPPATEQISCPLPPPATEQISCPLPPTATEEISCPLPPTTTEEISCPLPPPVANLPEPKDELVVEESQSQAEEQTADTSCSPPPPEESPESRLVEPTEDADLPPPAPQEIIEKSIPAPEENACDPKNTTNSDITEGAIHSAASIPQIPTDTTLLTPPRSPNPDAAATIKHNGVELATRESSQLELLDDSSNREFKTESVEDSLNSYNDSELELKERLAETLEDSTPVGCQLSNAVQENDQSKVEAPVENNVVANDIGTTETNDDAPKSPPPAVPAETIAPALGPAITEDVASVTKAIEEIDINEKAVAAAVNENIESANTNEIIADMNHQNNMIE